ncbi:apoptosis-antagonizing transcription factor, partial [Neohortaea acidophila]
MAPNRGRNRAHEFDDLLLPSAPDLDPEADDAHAPSSSDDEAATAAEKDDKTARAREHYLDVGLSKLRQPKSAVLGPRYAGAKVGREDFEGEDGEEDEDDPFERGFGDEESGSEGFELGDSEEEDEEEEDEETDGTDVSDEGAQKKMKHGVQNGAVVEKRYEALRSMMDETKDVTSRLALSNRADVEKGRAVKRQRTAFDSLLGVRIKLQKALVGANSAVAIDSSKLEDQDITGQAELAAFKLWSTLNDFREELIGARTGEKRKRSAFTTTTPSETLWKRMQDQDITSLAHRNATLKRWSAKSRRGTVQLQAGLLNQNGNQTSVLDTITEHLSNPDRLLKRAHTPRSCAPLQLAKNIPEDATIYDDADFYGLLLKDLLEQKSADSVAASNIDLSFSLRREAKTRKVVDTKASKGRKLRYTVHEKLQNFMAPEDRGRWGERQADELFGSLFGQRLGLGEE